MCECFLIFFKASFPFYHILQSHYFSIYYNSRLRLKLPIIDMELSDTPQKHLLEKKSTLLLQSFPIRHTFQKRPKRKRWIYIIIFEHCKPYYSRIGYVRKCILRLTNLTLWAPKKSGVQTTFRASWAAYNCKGSLADPVKPLSSRNTR